MKSSDCGPRQTWWLKSAQPLTSVASDKWPGFSEPQFPHLKTESNNCTYFTGLLESENEVIWAKCLVWCLAPNQPEIKVSYEDTVVNNFSDSASSRCLEQIPGLGISQSSVMRALMLNYYSKAQEGQLPPPQGAKGTWFWLLALSMRVIHPGFIVFTHLPSQLVPSNFFLLAVFQPPLKWV